MNAAGVRDLGAERERARDPSQLEGAAVEGAPFPKSSAFRCEPIKLHICVQIQLHLLVCQKFLF